MKKETLNICYQFLGSNVKVGALTDPQTRATFIKFFRELKKAAQSVIEEIQVAQQPPLDQAGDEAIKQVLGEEYEGNIPKIKEDILIELLAESKCEIPVMAVLNSFEGLIDEECIEN